MLPALIKYEVGAFWAAWFREYSMDLEKGKDDESLDFLKVSLGLMFWPPDCMIFNPKQCLLTSPCQPWGGCAQCGQGGFQLEDFITSSIKNHMTYYKFNSSHCLKLQHSEWR